MRTEQLAAMLIHYQQYTSMTDPIRFSSTPLHQQELPEFYGMDPSLFTKSPAERAVSIIEKTNATDVLLSLLSGKTPDDAKMRKYLGVSHEQLQNCLNDMNPLKTPVPDKTIILTFDDAKKDQYTHAAPLLKELGFGATFFVTEMEPSPRTKGFTDKNVYMTWEEIAELDRQGFEIGNHSHHHRRPEEPFNAAEYTAEIRGLNNQMTAYGLSSAASFAYPFGMCTQEQTTCASECGILWGRGNLSTGICGCAGKSVYDPLADNPLAIPSYGDPPLYTYERLIERAAEAKNGRIVCFAYHGVTDSEEWTNTITFEQHFRFLADNGFHGISMAQLSDYIDPEKAKIYTTI